MFLNSGRCREIVDTLTKHADAPELLIALDGGRSAHLRFAVNSVTQHQSRSNVTLRVRAAYGNREGAAQTNALDADGLRTVLRQAEAAARAAPENPEHMPPAKQGKFADAAAAWDEASVSVDPMVKARAVAGACGAAEAAGTIAAGLYEDAVQFTCRAGSNGLFAYQRTTAGDFSITVRTADGTGSARRYRQDEAAFHNIPVADLARDAIDAAQRSANPRPLAPGRYTVVLAPPAWDELLGYLLRALDARRVDEKRSCLYDAQAGRSRLGERVLGENITLTSGYLRPELTPRVFSDEGMPNYNVVWFDRGVLTNLHYSRYWAKKSRVRPNPAPGHVVIEGTDTDPQELIRSTPRGVYISSIWYVRMADPKDLTVTGLTRDGTFLIEDGKLSHPVNNFRFFDSPLRMLNHVTGLSKAVRNGNRLLPYMQVQDFNFLSASDAV